MLKMRAAITLLVLLLSICGSQTRSTQTEVHTESQSTGAAAAAAVSTQLDVSAELMELRDMVDKQGITLESAASDEQNMKPHLPYIMGDRFVFSHTTDNQICPGKSTVSNSDQCPWTLFNLKTS